LKDFIHKLVETEAQVWLVTVVIFAKILIAIVVLIVLLDGVVQFSMLI
jgi:hypothetical protein